ncbi:MAG: hypothetical protein WDM96_10895 [Lacunisphaera sp.]
MSVIRILVSFLVVAFGLLFAGLLLAAGLLSFLLRRLFGAPRPCRNSAAPPRAPRRARPPARATMSST